MTLKTVAFSDVGQTRDHNEDAVHTSTIDDLHLLVVADGMGGHQAGEVASKEALEKFVDEICEEKITETTVCEAVERANNHLREMGDRSPEYEGMGTTLVGAVVHNGDVLVVNVGDSRAYHVTADAVDQVTADHSLVHELVEEGTISEEEAKDHPYSSVLSQALGREKTVDPDTYRFSLQGTLLLCSDGLSDVVTASEIHDIVTTTDRLTAVAEELFNRAIENGSDDNITIALARYSGE